MPRQLASIIAEYAEHEGFSEPTVFTRNRDGDVRAHEFHEPTEAAAIARVRAVVASENAVATGLMLRVRDPDQVLVVTTDGEHHIAALADIAGTELGEWSEVPPGDPSATMTISLLRRALQETLGRRA
jgi:hypothetical protein